MALLQKIKSKLVSLKKVFNSGESGNTISMNQIMEMFSGSNNAELGNDLSEIVYFTCLKTLSESVGKMPCYLMDSDKRRISKHEIIYFLTVKPNKYQTPAQFFTYLEFNRNHYGNAYVYLNRDESGKIEGLYPLEARRVQIWLNNSESFTDRPFFYFYTDTRTGKSYWFKPEEILHFKSSVTDDEGLAGKSVREILATSFNGAKASAKFLQELYSNGLTASAVVKYTGDLNRESQDKLLDGIIAQSKENGRRLITLQLGFDIQRLDMTLADSQFFELKKYTALQIAAAFGISPDQINDLTKSSYASSAAQQLAFLQNTLLYIITNYEQELNCKLLTREEILSGLHFKFNQNVLLRANPETQADIIQKMLSGGVYSVNEARLLLDKPAVPEGEVRYCNGSYVSLENIGIAYERSGNNANNQE